MLVALPGQTMAGGVTSSRVTVKVQVEVFPLPSFAVRVTVWDALCPLKTVLGAGLWEAVGLGLQLSLSDAGE